MSNPFITETSFASPSLNRVRIQKLPGDQFEDQFRGQSGYTLLSSAALKVMIADQRSRLGIDGDSKNLLRDFNDCFDSPSNEVRQTARQIADAYGRRLALLILTLKQALPENRRARVSWNEAHWECWKQISTIHIGGGLVAGSMGPLAIESAKKTVRLWRDAEIEIQLSPLAAKLPLAGLARTAPPEAKAMLVLDFGNTSIKRAVADFQSTDTCFLRSLADLPAPIDLFLPEKPTEKYVQQLASQVICTVAKSRQEAVHHAGSLGPVIGMSLACYLMNGQPPPSEMGQYGCLQLLSSNLQTYLSERISAALNDRVQVNLVHDGTAAGLAFAGAEKSIALMLGTAIGVGFPPQTNERLRIFSINNIVHC